MNLVSVIPLAENWGMHGDFSAWWMLLMMPMMVLFWGAIIFGVVWLVRQGTNGSDAVSRRETPTEILDRRFAEGAISPEEYHERQEVIAHSSR
jgi:putative membrane protein